MTINHSRRNLLKWTAIACGATIVPLPVMTKKAYAAPVSKYAERLKYDKTGWGACTVNCGSRCPLQVHVKDGRIMWIETDNTGDDAIGNRQIRACLRGRSNRFRIYNPNRLKYPMLRVGKRGEGKFKRISWDEAFTLTADKINDIKGRYGNGAFYINYGTGSLGGTISKSWPPGSSTFARLMNCYGGWLQHYNDYSTANIADGLNHFYGGGWAVGNDLIDIANSKLVVLFGLNPCETRMSGGGLNYLFTKGLEDSDVKYILIDPRYSDSAVGKVDEWVPIRPGTDGALIAALAYVMLENNLQDQEFLDKYCQGFDEATLPKGAPKGSSFRAYVLGEGEDKTPKTPEWAAKITSIPAETIVRLANEIAAAKPAYITQGWGPQRHSNGSQISRSIATLCCMTGNVGIHGGNSGARETSSAGAPVVAFPVKENPYPISPSMFMWTDAIWRWEEMTDKTDGIRGGERLEAPIKFIWNYASNCLINQHAQANRTAEILADDSMCEFIVDINLVYTPSGQYSDLLLPDVTHFEHYDYSPNGAAGDMAYVIMSSPTIEPVFEAKTTYDMCSGIAEKLGIKEDFTEGKTHNEWVEHLWALSREKAPDLPTFEEMKGQGVYKFVPTGKPFVAYEAFRNDPEANPLKTPSGKIEIYSSYLAEIKETWRLREGQRITPIAEFIDTKEGYLDSKTKETYPLQFITHHYKGRTHSSYWEVAALREINPQEVWMNPIDAKARNITNGDMVEAYNDRGTIRVPAKVTNRIMPGVTSCPEGAWLMFDENGVDIGGNPNTLTSQVPTPISKGNGQHTNLINIRKVMA
ncbi:MAG: DMSO/selenate family reductase complex A subunit [Alphaproteobacteria bacterium]